MPFRSVSACCFRIPQLVMRQVDSTRVCDCASERSISCGLLSSSPHRLLLLARPCGSGKRQPASVLPDLDCDHDGRVVVDGRILCSAHM